MHLRVLPAALVALAVPASAALAQSTATPVGTFAYAATLDVMGQSLQLVNTRTVEAVTGADGAARFRIVDRTVLPPEAGGTTVVDSSEVDAATRLPHFRRLVAPTPMGTQVVRLAFTPTAVTGEAGMLGATTPVTTALTSPVFTGGGALELLFGIRPLAVGYTEALTILEPQGAMAPTAMNLSVVAQESVTVPAGTFDAFKLTLGATDGATPPQTIWVSSAAPHLVLRAVSTLGPEMGGGAMTIVLSSK